MRIQTQAETFALRVASQFTDDNPQFYLPGNVASGYRISDPTSQAGNHYLWHGDDNWERDRLQKSIKSRGFDPKKPIKLVTDGERVLMWDGNHRATEAGEFNKDVPTQISHMDIPKYYRDQSHPVDPELAHQLGRWYLTSSWSL